MQQTARGEPQSLQNSSSRDRFLGISGAARKKAARAWQQGRQKRAVRVDQNDEDFRAQPNHYLCRFFPGIKTV
jgi:hypothetical protein